MHLNSLVSALENKLEIKNIRGTENPLIKGLAYDSRDVKDGFLFFALKGIHTDGHNYVSSALSRGAVVIFHSDELSEYDSSAVYVQVDNTRTAMAPVSACFFGNPAEKLTVIGVTGTDGKSTTVSLIHQLLTLSGIKSGFISTVQFNTGKTTEKNSYRQSTPEPTEIHRILREMTDNGCSHAVIEATSHGLSPVNNRLGSIEFTAGVLTNISHEHLEFHKTIEQYIDDKANLFRKLKKNGTGIVNRDEPNAPYFEKAAASGKISDYSTKSRKADLFADNITETYNGETFSILWNGIKHNAEIKLPGIFNIENTLAALLAVYSSSDRTLESLIPLLPELKPVRGRMNFINKGQDFKVLIDYAHTPGAFSKLFPILKGRAEKRIISVFGSAGERDTEKRAVQGKTASLFSDIVILTDEDPRGEDSMSILKDIASGCINKKEGKNLFLIPERKEAIRLAFDLARKDDIVILLGKGHEGSIIYKDRTVPWDEEAAAVSVLQEMGYR